MPVRPAHLLIIEDDPDVAYTAQLLLRRADRRVETLADPAALARRLEQGGVPDLVLLDLNFTQGRTSGAEGLRVLDQLRALPHPPAVVAMTAYAGVPLAVEAMKRGACDFITKPWDNDRLLAVADAVLARQASAPVTTATEALMGESAAMRELRALIASVGPTEANVMVLGENGAGKELVAQAVHRASRRASGPFVAVDMGSLPESTFESELFGHRRGAFTDARSDRVGRVLSAAGGTLFLDEIGNLPLPAQAKLLTVLERRAVTPLGADEPQAVDVRVVSATNMNEAGLYEPATFRTDLLFRLNTVVLRVPPLRERAEDVPLLLDHFLAHYQQKYGRPGAVLMPSAFDALCAWPWRGNVRELRHACERAVILARGDTYTLADFGLPAPALVERPGEPAPALPAGPVPSAPALKLEALERDAISTALQRAHGNIARAARLLGVSRAALYRKLEKHGL